jgi:hypothetical protein
MVFRERIAAIGLSISVLYFLNRAAPFHPSSSFIVMKEIGVDSRTASTIEQVNDTTSARSK